MNYPLGPDDTFVTLVPRWLDLSPALQVSLLGVLLVVPVGLILWLSRGEWRLLRTWQAAGVLALRLGLVFLLWFLVAFRPALVHTAIEEQPSRVRVAVDISGSMDVRDPQRSLAEKIRLARALRLPLPGSELTEALLDAWLEQAESNPSADLAWTLPDELKEAPQGRLELGRRRRDLFEEWVGAVDRLSRKEIAERLLAPEGADLLGKLAARNRVEIVAFARQAHPVDNAHWREVLQPRPGAPRSAPGTDLDSALAVTADAAEPLLGIVLLSDGRHNVGPPPLPQAAELGRRHTPLYPIALGARRPPTEITVVDLQAPSKVFKGMRVPVRARVRVSHLPAQELTVELQVDGKTREPEHSVSLHHDGSDRTYTVEYQVTLETGGPRSLSVRARPSNGRVGAAPAGEKRRIILVGAEPAHVLLVDGEARWEYHYLASSLGRDPQVQLDRVLFVQPRLGLIKEDQLEKIGNPRRSLPPMVASDSDPLAAYDCIILGDVAPENLPRADRRRLDEYVGRRGGTLVLCAGKRYLPLAYLQAAEVDDPLLKLLPIVEPQVLQPPGGFTWRLSAVGRRTSFLQLQPEEPGDSWPRLPKHYWAVAGQRKPGAVVLAVADGPGADRSDDPKAGILVQQSYGAGRVVYLGLDSTWRWRAEAGDLYQHRFWAQLVLAAAVEKLLPEGNRFIRFGTREQAYSEGQEVEVVARVGADLPIPLKARAELLRRDAPGPPSRRR